MAKDTALKQQAAEELHNVAIAAAGVIKSAAEEAAKVLAVASTQSNTQNAVMGADITRIKEDIKEIKDNMKDVSKQYVTLGDFSEAQKAALDRETRLRVLEQNMWRQVGMSSVIASVIAVIITIVIKVIFK